MPPRWMGQGQDAGPDTKVGDMDRVLGVLEVFLDDPLALGWLMPLQAEVQENLLLFMRVVIPSVTGRAENRQSFKSNQCC